MVRKFVSVPPSQRLVTYGMPARIASSHDRLLRLPLRADEQEVSPRATVSVTNSSARVEARPSARGR